MTYNVIFTVGRMNPPTSGHSRLIKILMEKGLQEGVKKVHIILSSKVDRQKNPLEPEEKRYLLETYFLPRIRKQLKKEMPHIHEAIDALHVNILLTHEYNKYSQNNIVSTIQYLLDGLGPKERGLLIIGSPGFTHFPRVDVLLIDRKTIPISGTIVRTIAHISFAAFSKFYPGLHHKDISILYDALMEMEKPDENSLLAAKVYLDAYSFYNLRSHKTI